MASANCLYFSAPASLVASEPLPLLLFASQAWAFRMQSFKALCSIHASFWWNKSFCSCSSLASACKKVSGSCKNLSEDAPTVGWSSATASANSVPGLGTFFHSILLQAIFLGLFSLARRDTTGSRIGYKSTYTIRK